MDYMPEVVQVRPTDDFKVYVYFDDGSVKLYDAHELVNKGVFTQIKNIDVFKEKCTVLNGTLAWDVGGNYNESTCLDIDPFEIYENCPEADDVE